MKVTSHHVDYRLYTHRQQLVDNDSVLQPQQQHETCYLTLSRQAINAMTVQSLDYY